ncbi:MAG: response regulator [Polyangiaceae bacterium]|nr:response regulator [Polyangiaceae bacterium]
MLDHRTFAGSGAPVGGRGWRDDEPREILVVDDDGFVLRLLETVLAREGFQLTAVDDPLAALELVRASPSRFGVLLTDAVMPSMSGMDLARLVRDADPRIGIVLHSGTSHPPVPEVDLFVSKSEGIEHLANVLTSLLDQP